jgi:imidazolonepropionase
MKLIGPFRQILTMDALPMKGPIRDHSLQIIREGGVLLDGGRIAAVGPFNTLIEFATYIHEVDGDRVLIPGLIDSHTHICFAGDRAADYALKLSGAGYSDILTSGGGIHHTVAETRKAGFGELLFLTSKRLERHRRQGVTTCEIKSGYGLDVDTEMKILQVIRDVGGVSTCLAAHVLPHEFESQEAYLAHIRAELLPRLASVGCTRVDLFHDDVAFHGRAAHDFLLHAKHSGFDLTLHADQFSQGGAAMAASLGARSADHLEAISSTAIAALAASETVATVLPGACLGLGMPFPPARAMLDAGCALAIATDWNPGSAPNGNLVMQASVLAMNQKLSSAETFAGVTFRAAQALGLSDRGRLAAGLRADMVAFQASDIRDILYYQGTCPVTDVWIQGDHQP